MAVWIPFWKLIGFVLYVALFMYVCNAHVDYPEETATSCVFKILPIVQLILIVYSTDLDWLESRLDRGFSHYRSEVRFVVEYERMSSWWPGLVTQYSVEPFMKFLYHPICH